MARIAPSPPPSSPCVLSPSTVGIAYAYMEDLYGQAISPCFSESQGDPRSALPPPSPSPLRVVRWQETLQHHPNGQLIWFLIWGLQEGFRLGYRAQWRYLHPAKRNIPSAYEHPQVIDAYLTNECHLGRVLGPFTQPLCPLHINHFGVIPKKTQLGRWRLIVGLSFPDEASVNDGSPVITVHFTTTPLIWMFSRFSSLARTPNCPS